MFIKLWLPSTLSVSLGVISSKFNFMNKKYIWFGKMAECNQSNINRWPRLECSANYHFLKDGQIKHFWQFPKRYKYHKWLFFRNLFPSLLVFTLFTAYSAYFWSNVMTPMILSYFLSSFSFSWYWDFIAS